MVQEVQATSQPLEQEVRTQKGRWYLLRAVPYTVGPKSFSGIVLSFADVTRFKELQLELVEREAILKQTTRLAKAGSWRFILAGGEYRWSEEVFRLYGVESGQQPSVEENINFCVPEQRPAITDAFRRACHEGVPYDLVLDIVTANDRRRRVRATGWPVVRDGQVIEVSGVFQELAEA